MAYWPSVTNNTYNSAAKNIVIEDGATVRLNNTATKKIGISYAGTVSAPVPLLEGGRYALTDDDTQYVVADDDTLATTMKLDTILLRSAKPKFLFLNTVTWFSLANGGPAYYAVLDDWQCNDFEKAGADVTNKTGTSAAPTYLTEDMDLMQHDVIMLCAVYRNPVAGGDQL